MANSILLIKLTCLVVLCVVLGTPLANATLTCDEMRQQLSPCIRYLTGPDPGTDVPGPCCKGIKTLNDQAQTSAERQDVCRCLLPAFGIPGLDLTALANLPTNCGVDLPYELSPYLDCDSIRA